MTKFTKSTVLLFLPILCVLILTACRTQTGPVNYNVAGATEDIPTITSIVGDREVVGSSVTRYAKADAGNISVTCAYAGSSNPENDIYAYCEALTTAHNFTLKKAFDGTSAVLTTTSSIAGQSIQMTITANDNNGYTIVTEIIDTNTDSSVSADSPEPSDESVSSAA